MRFRVTFSDGFLFSWIFKDNASSPSKICVVELETSNRNITEYENIEDSDIVVRTIGTAILADMDANDTVFLQLVYDGGSQLDVAADSYFSGFLVA